MKKFKISRQKINGGNEIDEEFFNAVIQDNKDNVQEFLSQGADVNFINKTGKTALQYIAFMKDRVFSCSDIILNHPKLNINKQDNLKRTALHIKCLRGGINIKFLFNLLDSPDIQLNLQDQWGWTPLHCSAMNNFPRYCKALINTRKIKIDILDNQGNTPLHLAASNGNKNCIDELLIELNRKKNIQTILNIENKRGYTALLEAAENNHLLCVQTLLSTGKMNITSIDRNGNNTLIQWAKLNNKPEFEDIIRKNLKLIYELQMDEATAKDEFERTAFHIAAGTGDLKTIGILLDLKIDVNIQDIYGRTPLHYAAANGHTNIVKQLLKAENVNINIKSKKGETPLLYAAMQNHKNCVKLLLAAGANMDLQDVTGRTPLLIAESRMHSKVIDQLQKQSSNQTSKQSTDIPSKGGKHIKNIKQKKRYINYNGKRYRIKTRSILFDNLIFQLEKQVSEKK